MSALSAVSAGGAAAEPVDIARQRLQIEAQTRQLEAAFAAELAACAGRFAVTDCGDEVRLRRRATLAPLRARQLALDDAERSERAAARLAGIENKRQAQRASVPEPPPPRPATAVAAAPASAPLIVIRRHDPNARQGAASQAAARRAVASTRRQQEAAEAAERVRERIAERERSGKATGGLPAPPAATTLR